MPILISQRDPSGGAYYLVLEQAAYRRPHTHQGILVGEIVEAGEVQVAVVVHTYSPTGRRTRLAKARIWKPVYNHDLSEKSVPTDKDKRLMDYSPDFDALSLDKLLQYKTLWSNCCLLETWTKQ